MATSELTACFGWEFLGMCRYDPQAPSPSYFTIGDAVAALAFTLAVQQFLRPIYQFRLRAMGVRFSYVVCAVFIGATCTVVAAAAPSIAYFRGTILGHPINWEIAGGLIIGAAYAIVAIVTLRSATVTASTTENFTWAGAQLSSEATDDDRLKFANDILSGQNIQKLAVLAGEIQRAEWHATAIEFEKLREQGRENEGVRGRGSITAFYAFARRRELNLASHAWHFLQLLSDREFCRVVITRHPWGFLRAIIPLADGHTPIDAVRTFVQAVAWQALVQDNGMLAREDGYDGFGHRREFAKEFFGNLQMRTFEQLGGVGSTDGNPWNAGSVSRLNIASALMVEAEIKDRGFWDNRSVFSVVHIYENIARSILFARSENKNIDFFYEFSRGIADLLRIVDGLLETCDPSSYNILFAKQLNNYPTDSVSLVARLVSESLISVSNRFEGVGDPAWLFAHEILSNTFDRFGDVPAGLSPLQQAVAIKLIKKLDENLQGFYPTLSRVILAQMGPYDSKAPEKPGSAAAIFKDAVYFELKRLPDLYRRDPAKVAERLPSNVSYDHATRSLTHTYSGGQQARTMLDELVITPINLLDVKHLRRKEQ